MAAVTLPPETLPFRAVDRDGHSEVALAVQSATREAVEWVKSRGMMRSAEWASPLTTAPSAVGTMAILLKTASSKAAAGLPVKIRDVPGERGKIVGRLPYDLLHSNLQNCCDIGRSAFSDARSTMDYINKIAVKMVQDRGKVERILKMLENIEDARENLIPAIKGVENSAKSCLERVGSLTEDFQYWYWVICCLKNNVLDGQGRAQDKANQNQQQLEKAINEKVRQGEKEVAAQDTIKELEGLLDGAKKRVEGAQKEVDRLQNLPPIPEPDFAEELLKAERAIPTTERDLGLIGSALKALRGESQKDFAARQAHYQNLERRRKEYMDEAKKQRDEDRKIATDRLKAAREYETNLQRKTTKAVEELKKNKDRLADAKANVAKMESQFKRLGEEKLELADILKILEESSRQLGELKEQVSNLVKFFKAILEDVNVTVDQDVNDFLEPIQGGIRIYNGSQVVAEVKLQSESKERIRETALQIQGSFSGIRDITGIYVAISDRYIQPAIYKMEALSGTTGEEWDTQSKSFLDWCRKSMGEIEVLTRATTEKLESSMTERVSHLQYAIEAPTKT